MATGYQPLNLRITGVSALLMHNGQLADPLNHWAKAMKKVSGKRAKTDADHEELGRLEWFGSLYYRQDVGVGLPGDMIEAAFIKAAAKIKKGQQAKAGFLCDGFLPLEYDGPREPEALWANERFRLRAGVRNPGNNARVVRTRPRFDGWSCNMTVEYLPDLLNRADVLSIFDILGSQIGLGDWRPRFGRFTVEEADAKSLPMAAE